MASKKIPNVIRSGDYAIAKITPNGRAIVCNARPSTSKKLAWENAIDATRCTKKEFKSAGWECVRLWIEREPDKREHTQPQTVAKAPAPVRCSRCQVMATDARKATCGYHHSSNTCPMRIAPEHIKGRTMYVFDKEGLIPAIRFYRACMHYTPGLFDPGLKESLDLIRDQWAKEPRA